MREIIFLSRYSVPTTAAMFLQERAEIGQKVTFIKVVPVANHAAVSAKPAPLKGELRALYL